MINHLGINVRNVYFMLPSIHSYISYEFIQFDIMLYSDLSTYDALYKPLTTPSEKDKLKKCEIDTHKHTSIKTESCKKVNGRAYT